jgi:endo-1,4-beta-xylanase
VKQHHKIAILQRNDGLAITTDASNDMTAISRRRLLQMAAAGVAAIDGRIAAAAPTPSLGAIAASKGYLFGSAAAEVIDTDAAYRDLYVTQTKIITTDIALKIGRIAPQPGPKHFETADRLLAFCNQHRIAMRGHCLVWNEWNPEWVKNLTTGERRKYFDSYIEEVVARYSGKLQSWDIVNEPFWPGHNAPGGFRLGPWYDAFGPDYVRRAFERAAQVDRTTKFVLNEAQTERDDELGLAVRRGLLKLVADLKNAGVKLDVVGLQGHLQPQYPHDPARFSEFVHALSALGVDIYITEFDVCDDIFPDDAAARDTAVARTAQQFLETTLRHPAVKALITWELADSYSFYRGMARAKNPATTRLPRPLPYDDRLQAKPLWGAIAQAFESARRPDLSTSEGGRAE